MSKISFTVIALAALVVSPASAHVTLEKRQAPVGSYYKAVFAVPHGIADRQAAGANPGRRNRYQTDAQAGLDPRYGQGQIRDRV